MDICQKMLTSHTSAFTVTESSGTDRVRSATYDFLLVFHSTYNTTLYRFRDKRRNFQKNPHPVVFNAPAGGFLLEICEGGWG